MNSRDKKFLMKTALLAGKIMMENGAEVYRIEDTMERILRKGLGNTSSMSNYTYVTLSGLFVRIDEIGTDFIRVDNRTYNLNKTTDVNTLSRLYTSEKITIEEVYKRLKEVELRENKIPTWVKILSASILSAAIVLIFEGDLKDIFPGGMAGLFAYLTYVYISPCLKTPFISEYISTFIGGLAGYLFFHLLGGVSLNLIMIGAVVPLVPGITITNSIRDIMTTHYLSGMIRFMETFCIAFALGAGIVTLYYMVRLFGGSL